MAKSTFGNLRLRSRRRVNGAWVERWQARYTGPDRITYSRVFDGKGRAEAWLRRVSADIDRDKWVSPDAPKPESAKPVTLRAYADAWLADRQVNGRELAPTTRRLYRLTLDNQILPALGDLPVTQISPPAVRTWHAALMRTTGPRQRAGAYSLLRTILNTALADEMIPANPCRVRGAGQVKREREIRPASIAELEALAAAMPPRYRLMVLLAAWCALRFGELAELRRSDIDVRGAVVHVRRGVVRGQAGLVVKDTKSGRTRKVNIPPHLMPAVRAHLADHVAASRDALLFPAAGGGHMSPSSLYSVFFAARKKAGREDLRFHDLRHTGAVLAAATGATLAELMARLGHSTVAAAMRYQHASEEADKLIAAKLSELATVTPISAAKSAPPRKRKAAPAGG